MSEQYKPVNYLPIDYFSYPNRTAKNGESVIKVYNTLLEMGAKSPETAAPVSLIAKSIDVPRNTIYKALRGNGKGRPGFVRVTGEGPARWYFDTSIMPHPDYFTVDLMYKVSQGEVITELVKVGSPEINSAALKEKLREEELWKGYGIGREEEMPKYWEEYANLFPLVDMFNPTPNPEREITRPTLVETLDLSREGMIEALYTEKNVMDQASAIYSDVERKDFKMAAYRFTYLISYVMHHYKEHLKEEGNN